MKNNGGEGLYKFLWHLLRKPFEWIFAFKHDSDREDVPTLIISNHVTNYDPILVAFSFPGRRFHFVASEHLFRMGFISKVLNYLFQPIARRKGVSGGDTAMAILRKLKEGKTVGLFAEGETTWDGKTGSVVSATGRMAKMSGCRLVTYRLEGGYFTAPRWGKGIRRGRMYGRIVGVYSPQELKAMTKEQVQAVIERDIYEDAHARQLENPVAYGKRRRAERLESLLFQCPSCRKFGKLTSRGNYLHCSCGEKWEYTAFGTFEPAAPFENVAQWDAWQQESLGAEQLPRFREKGATLYQLDTEHGQQLLGKGDLVLKEDVLSCAGHDFAMAEISTMALVTARRVLFTVGNSYYEAVMDEACCLRKYLLRWQKLSRVTEPSV
ncbi:MAG: 1-acyl-sn-glycerol-3-phosphate acyltransferase [Oscillospiraceae bacterium]|nr:1-acyl-sn-glycerol-3-phosphate acyltransferase [Oscillospiraceae bacterium]